MHQKAPMFSHEHLVYPGLLALSSLIRMFGVIVQGDSMILLGGVLSVVLHVALFVFIALRKTLAFLIGTVLLFLSGAGSIPGVIATISHGAPVWMTVLLAVSAVVFLFGSYRMLRLWQGLRTA